MQKIPVKMQSTKPTLYTKQQLHKYVWICVGCLLLFLVSFPVACLRVSNSGKFDSGPFNSLTKDQPQKSDFQTPN